MNKLPVWRVTRSEYGHRLWEFLSDHGIRLSRLWLYRTTDLQDVDVPPLEPAITLEVSRGNVVDTDGLDIPLHPDDWVIRAWSVENAVGVVVLSIGRQVPVDPIDAMVDFEDGYLWGLFVDPAYRRRGIASGLLGKALQTAAVETDACLALVAPDNRPSQRVFDERGFTVAGTVTHVSLPGFRWTSDVATLPGVRAVEPAVNE